MDFRLKPAWRILCVYVFYAYSSVTCHKQLQCDSTFSVYECNAKTHETDGMDFRLKPTWRILYVYVFYVFSSVTCHTQIHWFYFFGKRMQRMRWMVWTFSFKTRFKKNCCVNAKSPDYGFKFWCENTIRNRKSSTFKF